MSADRILDAADDALPVRVAVSQRGPTLAVVFEEHVGLECGDQLLLDVRLDMAGVVVLDRARLRRAPSKDAQG